MWTQNNIIFFLKPISVPIKKFEKFTFYSRLKIHIHWLSRKSLTVHHLMINRCVFYVQTDYIYPWSWLYLPLVLGIFTPGPDYIYPWSWLYLPLVLIIYTPGPDYIYPWSWLYLPLVLIIFTPGPDLNKKLYPLISGSHQGQHNGQEADLWDYLVVVLSFQYTCIIAGLFIYCQHVIQ